MPQTLRDQVCEAYRRFWWRGFDGIDELDKAARAEADTIIARCQRQRVVTEDEVEDKAVLLSIRPTSLRQDAIDLCRWYDEETHTDQSEGTRDDSTLPVESQDGPPTDSLPLGPSSEEVYTKATHSGHVTFAAWYDANHVSRESVEGPLMEKIAELTRWQKVVMTVANNVFELDGCCHWETICEKIQESSATIADQQKRIEELEKTHLDTADAERYFTSKSSELGRANAEIARLKDIIGKTAAAWLAGCEGIPWEGAIDAAMVAAVGKIAEQQKRITSIINMVQTYQPGGSPPPGDELMLCEWVLETQQKRIEELEKQLPEGKSITQLIEEGDGLLLADYNAEIARLQANCHTYMEQVDCFRNENIEIRKCCAHFRAERDKLKAELAEANTDWDGELARVKGELKTANESYRDAYQYATRLFDLFAPQCVPMKDLCGVISQIDNYVTGVQAELAAATGQEKRLCELLDNVNKVPRFSCYVRIVGTKAVDIVHPETKTSGEIVEYHRTFAGVIAALEKLTADQKPTPSDEEVIAKALAGVEALGRQADHDTYI